MPYMTKNTTLAKSKSKKLMRRLNRALNRKKLLFSHGLVHFSKNERD